MRKSIAAAVIAASAATGACGQVHGEGAGPTVSRSFPVGNFHAIEVAGPYDVTVNTGANPGVSAQGSQKLLDHTTVEVEGDKLVIRPKREHGFFNWGWGSNGKASFTVTVPQIGAATLAGSGDLNVNAVQGNDFQAKLAGSGDLAIGSLNVQSVKLSVAGSGDTKIGGGRASSAEYDIVGSGGIDAAQVASEQLKVSIAGSGDVKAHATGTANVSIMGSGDVTVTGGAKCAVSKAGSGDVSCS